MFTNTTYNITLITVFFSYNCKIVLTADKVLNVKNPIHVHVGYKFHNLPAHAVLCAVKSHQLAFCLD